MPWGMRCGVLEQDWSSGGSARIRAPLQPALQAASCGPAPSLQPHCTLTAPSLGSQPHMPAAHTAAPVATRISGGHGSHTMAARGCLHRYAHIYTHPWCAAPHLDELRNDGWGCRRRRPGRRWPGCSGRRVRLRCVSGAVAVGAAVVQGGGGRRHRLHLCEIAQPPQGRILYTDGEPFR